MSEEIVLYFTSDTRQAGGRVERLPSASSSSEPCRGFDSRTKGSSCRFDAPGGQKSHADARHFVRAMGKNISESVLSVLDIMWSLHSQTALFLSVIKFGKWNMSVHLAPFFRSPVGHMSVLSYPPPIPKRNIWLSSCQPLLWVGQLNAN